MALTVQRLCSLYGISKLVCVYETDCLPIGVKIDGLMHFRLISHVKALT